MSAAAFNTRNLRGQSLLFKCLVTGFVTTAPALTPYQQGRGIDPTLRELVGERPSNWSSEAPTTVCETAECWSKGTSGHSDSTSSPSDARSHSRRRDDRNRLSFITHILSLDGAGKLLNATIVKASFSIS